MNLSVFNTPLANIYFWADHDRNFTKFVFFLSGIKSSFKSTCMLSLFINVNEHPTPTLVHQWIVHYGWSCSEVLDSCSYITWKVLLTWKKTSSLPLASLAERFLPLSEYFNWKHATDKKPTSGGGGSGILSFEGNLKSIQLFFLNLYVQEGFLSVEGGVS